MQLPGDPVAFRCRGEARLLIAFDDELARPVDESGDVTVPVADIRADEGPDERAQALADQRPPLKSKSKQAAALESRARVAIETIAKTRRPTPEPLTVLWLTPMRALAADTLRALQTPLDALAPEHSTQTWQAMRDGEARHGIAR